MNIKDFRVIFLYEFKLGVNASQTSRKVNEAFGEGSVTERCVQKWFKKFREGDMTLQNEEGQGRPSTVDDNQLKATVEENSRTTIRKLANELKVSKSTVSNHLKNIGKRKKLDRWVPHELTERNQNLRLEICNGLILRNMREPFIERIVTCDEKWIMYDNRKRSGQWLNIDEPPKKMPKPKMHQKKVMVSVWWSAAGIIHFSFLKPGETITGEKYCLELDEMHKKLSLKQPSLVNRKGPILLHDNARPHVSRITLQKLNALKYEVLPHPPYSPDLSPSDYYLFRHFDNQIRDKLFHKQEEAENAFVRFIESKSSDFYKKGILSLASRWQKCADSNGTYFNE